MEPAIVPSSSNVKDTDSQFPATSRSEVIEPKKTDYGANDTETRKKLRTYFHGNTFHIILAILIVLDLSIVLTDIILLLIYCDHIPHDIEVVVEDLTIVSIIILGTFLIELSIQMYAFGIKEWWKNCLHAFDFIITFVTFVMEIIFHNNTKVESMIGLLIVFRLWRLVRVVHITTEALELKHESEEIKHEHFDEELIRKYNDLQKENEQLLEELKTFRDGK